MNILILQQINTLASNVIQVILITQLLGNEIIIDVTCSLEELDNADETEDNENVIIQAWIRKKKYAHRYPGKIQCLLKIWRVYDEGAMKYKSRDR